MRNPPEINGRSNGGHFSRPTDGESAHYLTLWLVDAVPRHILTRYKDQLRLGFVSEASLHAAIDRFLKRPGPNDHLRKPSIAAMAEEDLHYFDEVRYHLHAWVIMPNHEHLLLTPKRGNQISSIVHSINSHAGTRASEVASRSGPFWSPDYLDQVVGEDDLAAAVEQIHNEPVHAGLCDRPEDWRFSSASKKYFEAAR
jgi:REP element-mobilizing transposase RayT